MLTFALTLTFAQTIYAQTNVLIYAAYEDGTICEVEVTSIFGRVVSRKDLGCRPCC